MQDADKDALKRLLLQRAIAISDPTISGMATQIVLRIAAFDLPDKWPGLYKDLIAALSPSANLDLVIGAIQTLSALTDYGDPKGEELYQVIFRQHFHPQVILGHRQSFNLNEFDEFFHLHAAELSRLTAVMLAPTDLP